MGKPGLHEQRLVVNGELRSETVVAGQKRIGAERAIDAVALDIPARVNNGKVV